jgi:hypothetical protein
MDFDPARIASPFRMQPGLRKLAPGTPQLTPLVPGSALHAEKLAVVRAGASRHVAAGFDPSPALISIAARPELAQAAAPFAPEFPELAVEEDLAVLDGDSGTLAWLAVCVPSHWAPEEKIGLDFRAVHAPVADAALLQASAGPLVALATGGECWERFVWTVSPSGRFDQHPRRHARTPWPDAADPDAFAARCFLRAERQTFFPVGQGTRQAVFTIRVMLQPLVEAAATPSAAAALHAAIASMSEAVLAYKGLAGARVPLLAWLDARR